MGVREVDLSQFAQYSGFGGGGGSVTSLTLSQYKLIIGDASNRGSELSLAASSMIASDTTGTPKGATGIYVVFPSEGGAGIAAALATANSAGGGIVQLLAGTYTISATVTWPSTCNNVVLQGVGSGTILNSTIGDGTQILYLASDSSTNIQNKAIDNTSAGGTSITVTTHATAANFASGTYVIITGTDGNGFVRKEWNELTAVGNGSTGVLSLRWKLRYSLSSAVVFGIVSANNGMRNFKVTFSGSSGIGVTCNCQYNAILENLYIDGLNSDGSLLGIGGINNHCRYLLMKNRLSANGLIVGVDLREDAGEGNIGLEFSFNTMVNVGIDSANHRALDVDNTFNSRIIGNYIQNPGRLGIALATNGYCGDVLIANNQIVRCGDMGIAFQTANCVDITIANNEIGECTNYGIYTLGQHITVQGNRCQSSSQGIRNEASNSVIQENQCYYNTYGITVVGAASDVLVIGNMTRGNATNGIGLADTVSNVQVCNNQLRGDVLALGTGTNIIAYGNMN